MLLQFKFKRQQMFDSFLKKDTSQISNMAQCYLKASIHPQHKVVCQRVMSSTAQTDSYFRGQNYLGSNVHSVLYDVMYRYSKYSHSALPTSNSMVGKFLAFQLSLQLSKRTIGNSSVCFQCVSGQEIKVMAICSTTARVNW